MVHHDAAAPCAATVRALTGQGTPVAVTVVDNASPPSALAELRAGLEGTGATILEAGRNLGYGPGANLGLRAFLAAPAAEAGEWVAVAAHDALPAPGCLTRLLAEAEAHPDAAFVCAEFGEGYDVVPAVDVAIGGYYRPATRGAGWVDVDYPHGTLFLARRAALLEVGLFDERYFAYCEEVDLGLRARALGWRTGLVWGAVVENGRLPAQLLSDYLQVRNTIVLVRTRFGPGAGRLRAALSLAPVLRRAVVDRRRPLVHLRLEGRAVLDACRHRTGPPPDHVRRLVERSG